MWVSHHGFRRLSKNAGEIVVELGAPTTLKNACESSPVA